MDKDKETDWKSLIGKRVLLKEKKCTAVDEFIEVIVRQESPSGLFVCLEVKSQFDNRFATGWKMVDTLVFLEVL
jgi:hypothetical protein